MALAGGAVDAAAAAAAVFFLSSAFSLVSNMTSDLRPTRSGRCGLIVCTLCCCSNWRMHCNFCCDSLARLVSTAWLRVIESMESASVSTLCQKEQISPDQPNGIYCVYSRLISAHATGLLVEQRGLQQPAFLEPRFNVVLRDALIGCHILQARQTLIDALQAGHMHFRLGTAAQDILILFPLCINLLLSQLQLRLIGGHIALQARQQTTTRRIKIGGRHQARNAAKRQQI